ncbi:MAG: MerR family transcriptional regulator [Bacteroidales bacterium]|jgi:DNA-binding transcriptional MerR regulator|nr:MerR family transcriptional regulator [Bacteroidales bacterium]
MDIAPTTASPDNGKHFYTIGEVAEKLGLTASLIRYWENEFDIIRPQKNKKGNRLFTQKDIEAISLIRHYVKERGMTLKGVRKKIRENRLDADNNFHVVHSLKQMRAFLLEIKDHLEKTTSRSSCPNNQCQTEDRK